MEAGHCDCQAAAHLPGHTLLHALGEAVGEALLAGVPGGVQLVVLEEREAEVAVAVGWQEQLAVVTRQGQRKSFNQILSF